MAEKEYLFFSRLITKGMQVVDGDRRLFKGYLTVEMVDKQNEITIRDELLKVVPIWINRGGPISDNHSNRIVGRGLDYEKTDIYDENTKKSYPAIMILGEIYKNYQLDDFIWDAIKTGEYKGLSFGGSTKTNRVPQVQPNGSIAYALKDLEQYEVAVCKDPAVPLALIVDHNNLAKSGMQDKAKYHSEGRSIIRCTSVGCYVEKSGAIYEGRKDHRGKKVLYEGGRDSKVRDTPEKKKYQDTFDVYNDKDAIADQPKHHKVGGSSEGGNEWSGVNSAALKPQNDKRVIEDQTNQQEPVITSGNQNDATGNDQTYRGSSGTKSTDGAKPVPESDYGPKQRHNESARELSRRHKEPDNQLESTSMRNRDLTNTEINTTMTSPKLANPTELKSHSQGSYPSTGPIYNDKPVKDKDYIGEKAKAVLILTMLKADEGYHGDEQRIKVPEDDRRKPSRDSAINNSMDKDDIKKVLPLLALAAQAASQVETSMDKDEKDLPIEKDRHEDRNAEYDELEAIVTGKIRPSSVQGTSEGASSSSDLSNTTGKVGMTISPYVADRNKENTDPEDSKQKPGSNALADEYAGMISGDIAPERTSTPGQAPRAFQIHPHLLDEGKSGDTFAQSGRIAGSADHDKEKYDYSMNGIVKDPDEKDIKDNKSSDCPTRYVDLPEEERESLRNASSHNKFNSAPSLQATGGEDGPNKERTNNDQTADGFVNQEFGNAKCTAPKDKSEIFLIGGTKGSFDTFQQGPGNSVQSREVPPKEDDTNAREVEHKDSGKKDPYNSINRATTNLLINLRAITILKQL